MTLRQNPLPEGVEIRLVESGDEGLFGSVADDVFDHPIDRRRLAAFLADPGHHLMVAIAGNTIVAQVAGVVIRHVDGPDEIFIENVGVAPDWRRRGIARVMMTRMLAHAGTLGAVDGWVGTEPDNDAARSLYAGLGGPEAESFVLYEFPVLTGRVCASG